MTEEQLTRIVTHRYFQLRRRIWLTKKKPELGEKKELVEKDTSPAPPASPTPSLEGSSSFLRCFGVSVQIVHGKTYTVGGGGASEDLAHLIW